MAEPAALNRLVQVRILVPQSEEDMAIAMSFFLCHEPVDWTKLLFCFVILNGAERNEESHPTWWGYFTSFSMTILASLGKRP